eukprot:746501-Hanusia_phi.AAC.3
MPSERIELRKETSSAQGLKLPRLPGPRVIVSHAARPCHERGGRTAPPSRKTHPAAPAGPGRRLRGWNDSESSCRELRLLGTLRRATLS